MNDRDLIVIGAGPAGLSAAIEAADKGVDVLIIDENQRAGGQLFKQIHKFFGSKEHKAGVRGIDIGKELLRKARNSGVEIWLNSSVIGLFKGKKVAVRKKFNKSERLKVVCGKKIVIATGASENAVSFKGWTLPGVMGAGAAQTMININRVLPGKKVLMLGSGNVGLIVSYQLLQAGAEIVGIVEAAPEIGGYGVHAAKISRAGVHIYTAHTIIKADGDGRVEKAVICQVDNNWKPVPGTEKTLTADVITIAAGLKPLTELAMMCECKSKYIRELGGRVPLHDENMESTRPGIYVVGDSAGVEEANTALEEGRLAGIAAAESLNYISEEKAIKIKEKIRKRLKELRLGPFGVDRMKGKEEIIRSYQKYTC